MSGRLLTSHASVPRVRHTHLVIGLEDGRELRLVDPRRFGAAVVLPRERLATHRALASLGPEALASDAEAALVGAARGSRVPIRNLLLDQTVVAGLGNIYATEALARVGIRPNRRAGTVSLDRLGRLAEAIYEVLSEAIVAGGTTLADGGFQDAAGSEGLFAVALRVYDRAGEPCPSCGSAIRRVVLAGRSSYFCPRCQK
jgi:formamidopyrimidine-DNA glycosylase